MYNYKSPIEIIAHDATRQFANQLNSYVFRAVIQYDINVDRDELLKALSYDRGQYEKGFGDGYRAAKDEIVRCKDCKWWEDDICTNVNGAYKNLIFNPDWYCASGERKENAN